MKLLVGPVSEEEVKILLDTDVNILDVKNTKEGSYGAAKPRLISNVKNLLVRSNKIVSATLGDLPNKPGTAALAALGAVKSGASILKVGLHDATTYDDGLAIVNAIEDAISLSGENVSVFVGGYADYEKIGSIQPETLIEIAKISNSVGVMLDTAYKDGESLFDILGVDRVRRFVRKAHDEGLEVVLAGSIQKSHIHIISDIKPDVVAVRGSVCVNGDRTKGIDVERVKELVNNLKKS